MPAERAFRLVITNVAGWGLFRFVLVPERAWDDVAEQEALVEFLARSLPPGVVNFVTNAPEDAGAVVEALLTAHPAAQQIAEKKLLGKAHRLSLPPPVTGGSAPASPDR